MILRPFSIYGAGIRCPARNGTAGHIGSGYHSANWALTYDIYVTSLIFILLQNLGNCYDVLFVHRVNGDSPDLYLIVFEN